MKILFLASWGFLFLTAPLYCFNSHLDLFIDKQACGGKLILPCTEVRFSQKLDNSNSNFGVLWTLEDVYKKAPCSIKCGSLSPGGLYSKLKNPLLTSGVTPFSSPQTDASCLTTSLPSYSNFSKEDSYFFELGYKNRKSVIQDARINYFNSAADSLEIVSSKIKLAVTKKLNLAGSVCGGYFEYADNESNSWFVNEQYYQQGIHFCTASQLAVTSPVFSSLFSFFLYESPFGYYQNVYRLENKLKSKHFIYTLSSAYVPEKCITSSDKSLSPLVQVKSGLQYQFLTGHSFPVFVKTGINTFANINLTQEEHDLKIGAGVAVSSLFYSINISTTLNNTVKMTGAGNSQIHFESGNIKIKNSWYIKSFTPTIGASFSYNPSDDYTSFTTTQGYELNFSADTNPSIVLKNKVTLEAENLLNQGKNYTGSIVVKTRIKQVNVTGKLSLSLDF